MKKKQMQKIDEDNKYNKFAQYINQMYTQHDNVR